MRNNFSANKMLDDSDDYGTGRELVRTDLIRNVYIEYPMGTSIRIVFENKKGGYQEMTETFECEKDCLIRFHEINRILNKGVNYYD